MIWLKQNWFKITAAILLLWALADNPYSYYQFLRWAITIIGAYTAYLAYNKKQNIWIWIFVIIAILFNPLAPFYLSKDTWQLFDFIAAIIFLLSSLKKEENKKIT